MVQKIHPRGVIWDPNSAPYVARFQILKLLSKCSILEPSLHNVKSTVKISSIFVAFLENMNFKRQLS